MLKTVPGQGAEGLGEADSWSLGTWTSSFGLQNFRFSELEWSWGPYGDPTVIHGCCLCGQTSQPVSQTLSGTGFDPTQQRRCSHSHFHNEGPGAREQELAEPAWSLGPRPGGERAESPTQDDGFHLKGLSGETG